jgi:hypothetical protein
MPSLTSLSIAWASFLAICAGTAEQAVARPGFEVLVSSSVHPAAAVLPFASKEGAKAFLAEALPRATAGNPKYRSSAEGVLSAWITRSIKFENAKDSNDLIVSMTEDALEFRGGAQTARGTHDTQFVLGAVTISERRDEGTLDENGKPALAILFQCASGKCIRAVYDGEPTMVDLTDISIQDAKLRAEILAAFQMLERP